MYIEHEFKYDASNISPKAFLKVVGNCKIKFAEHLYFSNHQGNWIRFKIDNDGYCTKITVKKLINPNSVISRYEAELYLNGKENTLDDINAFANLLGYKFHGKLIQHYYDKTLEDVGCHFSYKIIYNEDMVKLGQFIEIEAIDNILPSIILEAGKHILSKLGLDDSAIVPKSTYDLFISSKEIK